MSTKVRGIRTKEVKPHPAAVLGASAAVGLLCVVCLLWLMSLPLDNMPGVLQMAVFSLVISSVIVAAFCSWVFIFTLLFRSNHKEWRLK